MRGELHGKLAVRQRREYKKRPDTAGAELPEKQENKSRIYHRYPTWASCLVLVIIDGTLSVCTNLARSFATAGFILNVSHAFVTIHEAGAAQGVGDYIPRARAGCGGHGQRRVRGRWWLEAEWLL